MVFYKRVIHQLSSYRAGCRITLQAEFRKLFASEERLSGISGMPLLFPILNVAATYEIHPRLADNQLKN
jgi:hypothetical protein